MGGKRRKKPTVIDPQDLEDEKQELDILEDMDRSDYFHGDMDEGGVRVTEPTEDDWEEE